IQDVHVFARANRAAKLGETYIYTPTDLVPIGTGVAELQGLGCLVGMGGRVADGLDVGVGKGKYGVTRCDFSHEVVERIACIVFLALWGPQVTARYFMPVGLFLVYPPIAHAIWCL